MKALVTGATGYVGAELALQLAAGGHTVHALYRSREKAQRLAHANIRVFLGDVMDEPGVDKAMETCTHVFHTAAYVSVWAKDPETYHRINVAGTENILRAALKHGIERVVVTSTAGVFGPSEPGEEVDELKVRTVPCFTEYEVSKTQTHEKVAEYVKKGLDALLVCPTRIYGPGLIGESNSVTKMIDLYLRGRWRLIPGDGERLGNYVYIGDVVNGHLLAMEKGGAGEIYLLGGENITYNGLFALLNEASGVQFWLYRVPLPAMMAFACLQLLGAKLFDRKPLITPPWVRRYVHDWSNSSRKAMRELDYTVTPLRTGVSSTIEWLNGGNHF